MAIEALDVLERTVRITWDDGEADEFHHLWLRDHGAADGELHAGTGERVVDFHSFPTDVRPLEVALEEGEALRILWSDRSETRHDGAWLRAHSYAAGRPVERGIARDPWRAEMGQHLPRFDYGEVVDSEMTQLSFLRALVRGGFAILTQAPTVEGEVERLAGRLGYLREICFGRLRDIRVEPSAYNIAFTDGVVRPHTDLANYVSPPGVQFLHCLVQEATGGNTRLVDGLTAASDLRAEDPEAFEALTLVAVGFQIANRDNDVRTASPIISLGPEGEFRMIRFSNQARRSFVCRPDLVEPFYRGYRRLSELLNDPANQVHFRLAPGEIVAMDNHRVLHARDAFDAGSGRRHLQIGSMDMDDILSRIRIIERRLNDSETRIAS